jgi:lipid-A-disaccharide synthase-like uncharacterized protein
VDQQDGISIRTGGRATVHNDDIVGIFSYNIFVGIAVATIFGSGFFFDLFWPERKESKSVRLAWKICSVLVSIMALADALALTVSATVCMNKTRSNQNLYRLLLQSTVHTLRAYHQQKHISASARMAHQTLFIRRTPIVLLQSRYS